MMCHREDDDAVFVRTVDNCEREVLNEHSSSALRGWRSREWKCEGARRGFFDRCGEANSKPRLLAIVLSDF